MFCGFKKPKRSCILVRGSVSVETQTQLPKTGPKKPGFFMQNRNILD